MNTISINSFEEYISYTEDLKGRFYFRGQADASWPIRPSCFRPSGISFEEEKAGIRKYIEENPNQTPLSALFNLQHYETKTRICDLTISPLSALFFASDSETNRDGAVYIIDKSQAVVIDCPELEIFSSALVSQSYNVDDMVTDDSLNISMIKALTSNYIVQHRDLVYSNPRSMRQGGTGLVFGFSYEDGMIGQKGTADISALIMSKIIIPKKTKHEIMANLRLLGYSKEILYNAPETIVTEPFKLIQEKLETKTMYENLRSMIPIGTRVTVNYKISTLYYDMDELANSIQKIISGLIEEYGENARIFLGIRYDENYRPYLCRCDWSDKTPYIIKWTKNFIADYLVSQNNQISESEETEKFKSLLRITYPIFEELRGFNLAESTLDGFVSSCLHYKEIVNKAFLSYGDIGLSTQKIDKLCENIADFLCALDNLILETGIYSNREDMALKTRIYMANLRLDECRKSLDLLIQADEAKIFSTMLR